MKALLATFLLLVLAAPAAWSEHPWSVFFEGRYAIEQRGTSETVELEGNIVVSRSRNSSAEEWVYTGVDRSGSGAAGCIAIILVEIEAMNRGCPNVLNAKEKQSLASLLELAADFYEANNVPPITREEFFEQLDEAAKREAPNPKQCELEDSDGGSFARNVLSSASIAEAFEEPRLPVTNPCL